MYIPLLKKILINTIYEPDLPTYSRQEFETCENIIMQLASENIDIKMSPEKLVNLLQYTKKSRNIHTYVNANALDNIHECLDIIKNENIEGDIIDCGVLRGGTSILMAGISKYLNMNKHIFVADSFEGLPTPSEEDGVFAKELWYRFTDDLDLFNLKCIASIEDVKSNFKKYDLLSEQIIFLQGWFSETLSKIDQSVKFSLIRIDVDWYSSTMDVLLNIYKNLTVGGFIIIDDYNLIGCKNAVDEFRLLNNINSELYVVDQKTGVVYWRKEK